MLEQKLKELNDQNNKYESFLIKCLKHIPLFNRLYTMNIVFQTQIKFLITAIDALSKQVQIHQSILEETFIINRKEKVENSTLN